MTAIILNLKPTIELTDAQFESICSTNRDLRFERSATGELIIMPPTGGDTGNKNWSICGQLWQWNQQFQLGKGFDSSTGFILANGATRSPDAAWIKKERWDTLTSEQRKKFIPLCPDFAVELRSHSDNLSELQQKMQEYLDHDLLLGWLIDPQSQQVLIYQANCQVQILSQPTSLSGDDILPGFILDLTEILTD